MMFFWARYGRQTGFVGDSFVAYFWFVGWWALSLGFHISVKEPNVEIHLPFGFIRIGKPAEPGVAIVVKSHDL